MRVATSSARQETSVLSWLKSSEAGVASSVGMVSQGCGVHGEKVDVEGHVVVTNVVRWLLQLRLRRPVLKS